MPLDEELPAATIPIETAFQAELELLESPQRERLEAIIALTDQVCREALGPREQEYRAYCRLMAAQCYQLIPQFLAGTKQDKTWAAGMFWAIVTFQLLSEPFSSYSINARQIAKAFKVPLRTMKGRGRMIVKKQVQSSISQLG